jgi:hypothetical protein
MQGAVQRKMYGLAYLTAASAQPGSSFSADGEVSASNTLHRHSSFPIARNSLPPLLGADPLHTLVCNQCVNTWDGKHATVLS